MRISDWSSDVCSSDLNFIDIYHRTGLYPGPLPSGIGSEAVGVVEAAAPDVTNFAIGDHVGYAMGQPGAYASGRTVCAATDRKRVGSGESVSVRLELGGRLILKKKKIQKQKII